MTKWYLCGPMSGIPEQNYPEFRRCTALLRSHGFNIVSPHETMPNPDGGIPWEVCLKQDLNTLTRCHGVIVLDGWTRSRGARLEVGTALALGMPILTFYKESRLSTLDGGHPFVNEHFTSSPWNTGE